jgi:hypothetical protein
MTTSVKTCFKCGAEKPLTDFYVHPQMGDGRLNKCKECTKRDVQKNYRDNVEHYREYERKRFQQKDRKESIIKHQRTRRARNPEKEAARRKFTYAVRTGKIERPDTCEKCGAEGGIQGHHHDYSKPLDVAWLCFKCHRAEHGQEAVWTPPVKEANG